MMRLLNQIHGQECTTITWSADPPPEMLTRKLGQITAANSIPGCLLPRTRQHRSFFNVMELDCKVLYKLSASPSCCAVQIKMIEIYRRIKRYGQTGSWKNIWSLDATGHRAYKQRQRDQERRFTWWLFWEQHRSVIWCLSAAGKRWRGGW